MKTLGILFQAAEFLAALVGTIYIMKYRVSSLIRYFVYFLWFNFFVEMFGKLPTLISTYDSMSFLKGTLLSYKNAWLYNIHSIISIVFYTWYFKENLISKKFIYILNVLIVVFFVTSVLNLLVTDDFFKVHSAFPMITGTLIILISVFFYFFEMLKSEKILEFNKDLVFYIAIGTMVLHLVVAPLFIYSSYYSKENVEFVKIRVIILYCAIIFTYTCYTIGFVVCSRKNKSY
ncbi:hypothetical protein [Aquimarina sp. AU119]|uniref:hypothetical protein n=1 Tax=Aquimarina sp. AU119 TaxID=2108528 RepID=UPI000D696C2D|nr:hypothetical protein [Aquimarina sp. AU119]